MNAAVPKLDARLASLLDERAADVETMRERTTPWTAFIADVAEVDTGAGGAKLRRVRSGRGRIGKIERVRVGEEREDVDSEALAMFERWADEVVSLQRAGLRWEKVVEKGGGRGKERAGKSQSQSESRTGMESEMESEMR